MLPNINHLILPALILPWTNPDQGQQGFPLLHELSQDKFLPSSLFWTSIIRAVEAFLLHLVEYSLEIWVRAYLQPELGNARKEKNDILKSLILIQKLSKFVFTTLGNCSEGLSETPLAWEMPCWRHCHNIGSLLENAGRAADSCSWSFQERSNMPAVCMQAKIRLAGLWRLRRFSETSTNGPPRRELLFYLTPWELGYKIHKHINLFV